MLRLSNGRVVGIMHERAREHALRLKMKVSETTPLQQLYPLIDIVIADANAMPQHTVFSGHTLADRRWIGSWKAEDRERFYQWLDELPQRREIERARARLLADEPVISPLHYRYPKRLYSVLRRRLKALPMKSAPPQQWKRTIEKLSRNGIRMEEIRWSGVLGFLDHLIQEGVQRLSRRELIRRIDFSDIRIDLSVERERSESALMSFEQTTQRIPAQRARHLGLHQGGQPMVVVRYLNRRFNYQVGYRRQPYDSTAPLQRHWFVIAPDGLPLTRAGLVRLFDDEQAAMEAARQHLSMQRAEMGVSVFRNRYDVASLRGGEGYREWLVTLPDYPPSYFGGHYSERNLLMHIRTTSRRDISGRRLLFIEELQSDWHQNAMKYGFDNSWSGAIPMAPFRRDWVTLGLKLMLLHAADAGYDAIAWSPGYSHEQRYGQTMPPIRRLYDQEVPKSLAKLLSTWGAEVGQTTIATREPWLQAIRIRDKWRITDNRGHFSTHARFDKQEALQLIERHSRPVEMPVGSVNLDSRLREELLQEGLPLFGVKRD